MRQSDICRLQNAGATPQGRGSGRRRSSMDHPGPQLPAAGRRHAIKSAPAPPSYDRTHTSVPFSARFLRQRRRYGRQTRLGRRITSDRLVVDGSSQFQFDMTRARQLGVLVNVVY